MSHNLCLPSGRAQVSAATLSWLFRAASVRKSPNFMAFYPFPDPRPFINGSRHWSRHVLFTCIWKPRLSRAGPIYYSEREVINNPITAARIVLQIPSEPELSADRLSLFSSLKILIDWTDSRPRSGKFARSVESIPSGVSRHSIPAWWHNQILKITPELAEVGLG